MNTSGPEPELDDCGFPLCFEMQPLGADPEPFEEGEEEEPGALSDSESEASAEPDEEERCRESEMHDAIL